MSWLRAGLGALRALACLTATGLGIKAFATSRLKASAKALRDELRAQGLPKEAVRELTRFYLERGQRLLDSLLSPRGLGKLMALGGPPAPWSDRRARR